MTAQPVPHVFLREQTLASGSLSYDLCWNYGSGDDATLSLGVVPETFATELQRLLSIDLAGAPRQYRHALPVRLSTYRSLYPRLVGDGTTRWIAPLQHLLDRFEHAAGDALLPELTTSQFRFFIQRYCYPGVTASTSEDIRILHLFFQPAVSRSWIPANPLAALHRSPAAGIGEDDRFLSHDEIQKLRSALEDHPLSLLVDFYLLTGVRPYEAFNLFGQDVDLDGCLISIQSWISKTRVKRTIPFAPDSRLSELLTKLAPQPGYPLFRIHPQDHVPLSEELVKRTLKQLFVELSIPWRGMRVFRHTFASHLVMRNVPLLTVSQLLGHSDVRITETYYCHLSRQHLEHALNHAPIQP